MPERKDPIEEKSFAWLFFLVTALLVVGTLWAVYDEVIGRRPWKHYQKEFLALADAKSSKELKDATAALSSEDYGKLRQEYDRVRKALEDDPKQKEKIDELQKIDREIAEQIHELQLHRGEYQAIVYVMEKAEGETKSGLLHKAQGLEPCIEEISGKLAIMQKRKKELRAQLKGIAKERDVLEEKLLAYEEKIKGIQRYRESLKREKIEIKQVVNEELGIIDRCHSCHAGVVTRGFEDAKQPFKTHSKVVSLPALAPGLPERGILDVHPIETFGCTPCHRGQGYATTTAQKAHGELEYVLSPMFRGKYNQGTCFKCHDYEIDIPGGEVVSLGRKLFHEYGCIGCHSVGALEREDKTRYIGPTLDEIGSKVHPGWLGFWINNPKEFRADTKMPRFFLNPEEIKDVASYLWQLSQKTSELVEVPKFEAEVIEEGKNRFESVGCLGCHRIEEKGSKFAPNLSNVGEKIRYDYLVSWITDPKKHQPIGRMPNLRLTEEEEASKIAAYLTTLKTKEPCADPVDYSDPKRAEAGFNLIARYGCFGCHTIKGMEDRGKIGVDLSDEGVKPIERFDFALLEHEVMHKTGLENPRDEVAKARIAWLSTKLKDPRIFDTGKYKKPEDMLRMPNPSLNDQEVQALVTFIVGLTGEKVPAKFKRNFSERDRAIIDGTFLIRRYNCVGCHPFTLEKLTLADGTKVEGMTKLEEEDTLFFQLWHDYPDMGKNLGENIAVELAEVKERVPTMGGEIVPLIIGRMEEEQGLVPEEARAFAPPFLYGEGKRVQADWLYRFVQAPVYLRPWLNVRMPTFGLNKEEALTLSKYFALFDNQEYPYERLEEREKAFVDARCAIDPDHYVKAKKLMDSKDVNCGSCHVRGELKPSGDPSGWAPDLSLAKERLRPDWIRNWLTDPQRIQVGTKMPKFPWGEYQDIFPGKPEEQVEAIKDLIMSPGDLLTRPPEEFARR